MKTFGIIIDKFGKPTINLSCQQTDDNYRKHFGPVQSDSPEILNLEDGIINADGFPTLHLATHLLQNIQFPDGRHRVLACNRAFGDTVYHQYVLCHITNFQDSIDMMLDSYKKSENRPVVFASIHDALECLPAPMERGLDLQKFKEKVTEKLGISKSLHLDRFCKLSVHMFPRARKLLDTHRDSMIFTKESIFGTNGKWFVSLIQEAGNVQLSCYRYNLSRTLVDLTCKEELQVKCILLCHALSQRVLIQKDKPKVLLMFSERLFHTLKEKNGLGEPLSVSELPVLFGTALTAMYHESVKDWSQEDILEAFGDVFSCKQTIENIILDESLISPTERSSYPEEDVVHDPSCETSGNAEPISDKVVSSSPADSTFKKSADIPYLHQRPDQDMAPALEQTNVEVFEAPSAKDGNRLSSNVLEKDMGSLNDSQNVESTSNEEQPVDMANPTPSRRSNRIRYLNENASKNGSRSLTGKRAVKELDSSHSSSEKSFAARRHARLRKKARKDDATPKRQSDTISLSEKAECSFKCLSLASKYLERMVFLRLDHSSSSKSVFGTAFGRVDKLSGQGVNAVVLVDQSFIDTEAMKPALESIVAVTPNVNYMVSFTKNKGIKTDMEALGLAIASSGRLVLNQESSNTCSEIIATVFVSSGNVWTGPKSFELTYDFKEKDFPYTVQDFLRSFWKRAGIDMEKYTIFDLMLGFHDSLNELLELGFEGTFFKCLTLEQEETGLNTKYLQTLRNKILQCCTCGGHELLTAGNEESLNEYKGPAHDCDGIEKHPFLLTSSEEDVCPFGEIFSHTSLLLRKDIHNGVPHFSDSDGDLCCRETNPETGYPLHRGAFVSQKVARDLENEKIACDVLFPKCYLVDSLSKTRHYESSLSPFEMRDLFVAGITYRKLWLFFSNRSVASLFNEGKGGGEIDFTPRWMDLEYIDEIYRNGLAVIKDRKMSLICCTLKPGVIKDVPSTLRCQSCGAIELLTDYGREYVHD